jgi:hypothetical protein
MHNVCLLDHKKGKRFSQSPAPMEILGVAFCRSSGGRIADGCRLKPLARQRPIVEKAFPQIASEAGETSDWIFSRREATFKRIVYSVTSGLRQLAEAADGQEQHDSSEDNAVRHGPWRIMLSRGFLKSPGYPEIALEQKVGPYRQWARHSETRLLGGALRPPLGETIFFQTE